MDINKNGMPPHGYQQNSRYINKNGVLQHRYQQNSGYINNNEVAVSRKIIKKKPNGNSIRLYIN